LTEIFLLLPLHAPVRSYDGAQFFLRKLRMLLQCAIHRLRKPCIQRKVSCHVFLPETLAMRWHA